MPPTLALLLTSVFIVFLFRRDSKERPNVTAALWIPFWWVIIACSRPVSAWLALFGFAGWGGSLEEGSPIDRLFYFGLIFAGLRVLAVRKLTFGEVIRNNGWVVVFLAYCALAVLWSDFPIVSLKRWIKVIGHPIMALVVLTEPNLEEAVTRLLMRCAYVILPVSVLFIKYYPHLGRSFSEWTGEATNTGITDNKNILGLDCLIIGFFFVWHGLRVLRWPKGSHRSSELRLCIFFLSMTLWLLSMADSKTSAVALCVGLLVILFVGSKWVNKHYIGAYLSLIATVLLLSEWLFDASAVLLRMLGRDPTLTDRTLLWEDLLRVEINPWIGTGFESFWLGERLQRMWDLWAFRPNQAHNGYLETYLNLGLVGLALMLAVLLSNYYKARREISLNFDWGRFRLGFLVALIVYNWTEAAFKATHPLFLMLYLIVLDLPARRQEEVRAMRDGCELDKKSSEPKHNGKTSVLRTA